VLQRVLEKIKRDYQEVDNVTLRFQTGMYHFFEKNAASRQYYISNHDQTNPKNVGIAIENMKYLTLDGQGSD
ncbi:alpha-1,3-galactosidase B, partial [Bacteroides nordii]|nr:alpha-1,3-galactosidase B [Bacteroides nordii]